MITLSFNSLKNIYIKRLLSILFMVCACKDYAQYGNQHSIIIPISNTQNAVALIHLPNDYNADTIIKHPLIVGLVGVGEYGTSPKKLTQAGLGEAIYTGSWDGNAINPITGTKEKFVAVSILPSNADAPITFSQIDYVLTWLYAHYRIDTNCVALTGLSRGGGTTVYYPSHTSYVNYTDHYIHEYSKPSHILAAIIPMSAENNQNDPVDSLVKDSVHVWGFGSEEDIHGISTHMFVNHINAIAPLARFTEYAGGHCCWAQFYNASYKEAINGLSMNIYQFVLYHCRH